MAGMQNVFAISKGKTTSKPWQKMYETEAAARFNLLLQMEVTILLVYSHASVFVVIPIISRFVSSRYPRGLSLSSPLSW